MSDKLPQFYYKKSRLQQLRGFCYTVQKGSAKAAATKMGLDASAVSLQIKSLEDDLGVKLFDRVGKRLVLNEKGKKFYEKAVTSLQSVDGLFEDFLLEEDREYQNTLNIAGHSIVLSHLLIDYLSVFNSKYPNIKISLNNISKDECKRQIIDKKIDMGTYIFLSDEKLPVELDVIRFKSYKFYVIMHKDHPLSKFPDNKITEQDIAKARLAYIPELITMENFKNYIKKYKIKSYIDIKNGNLELLRELVGKNLCIGIIPAIYYDKNKDVATKNVISNFLRVDAYYGVMIKKDRRKEILNNFLTILDN